MATLANGMGLHSAESAERRFFLYLSLAMSAVIVAGFSLNLAMGRSSFAVPAIYHLHAVIFFGWVVLFNVQAGLIAGNNRTLHRRLGILALGYAPMMAIFGVAMMITALRRNGGPFFFSQNLFLFSNGLLLIAFVGMVLWALRVRRHMGWHRRIMTCAMAMLCAPGVGRILPMPMLIPYAWEVGLAVVLVFPIAGMIRDKLRRGTVHRAWYWGIGVPVCVQIAASIFATSPIGITLTERLIAGTPGAERPMEALIPPGFAM